METKNNALNIEKPSRLMKVSIEEFKEILKQSKENRAIFLKNRSQKAVDASQKPVPGQFYTNLKARMADQMAKIKAEIEKKQKEGSV